MSSWSHLETAADWAAWEASCTEMGEVVKGLKTSGGEKEQVDAAVAELLHRKKMLTEALNGAIAAAPDEAAKEVLRAKLPPAPKLSKSDKKKEKSAGGAPDAAAAEKEANMKKNEELKAAARAKKKAEADAKKAGGAAAAPPPAAATKGDAAAAKPPAAQPKPKGGAPTAPAAAAGNGGAAVASAKVATKAQNKSMELLCLKESPPLMALMAAKLAKREVVLKKVEAKQLAQTGGRPLLLLPLGAGSLCGDLVIARYFARLPPVPNAPSQMYGTPNDAMSASQVDEFIDSADALATANGGSLSAVLTSLNSRLAMRATLCGHSVRRVLCPLRLPPSPAHTPPVASCLPPGLARRRGHVAGPEAQLAG